jgi:predicted PurR-regulated permease PerM
MPGDEGSFDALPHEPAQIAAGTVPVRSLDATVIVAAVALLVLREAAPVLVPVLVSILLAYALEPVVAGLAAWRLPRPLATAAVYLLLGAAIAIGARQLRLQVDAFLDDLPTAIATLQQSVTADDTSSGWIDRVRSAATAMQQTAAVSQAPAPPGVSRVTVVGQRADVRDYLATVSHGLIWTTVQLLAIACLTFLLLATGDLYKRKLVKLAGPGFANRKITLDLIRSIDRQIERYLQVRALISVLVGVATAAAVWLLGLNHAVAWGVVAGALNVLPFIGPGAAIALVALAAFVQFKTLAMAAAAGGAAFVVAAIEGNVLTPLFMSRAGELNIVAVFVSVLVWGWLWDVWGLLLAVPIMVAVKTAADHIEALKPIGELLSR